MKKIANLAALAVSVFAWALMMTTDYAVSAWALLIGTWVVMKLTGMTSSYPFDWLINSWRGR